MFAQDLADIDLKGDDLDGIISEFETKLRQTLDKHSPEVTKKITERKRQPWFDDNITNLKRYVQRREKVWRKYKQLHWWRAFKDVQCTYNTALQAKQVDSINNIIVENETPRNYTRYSTTSLEIFQKTPYQKQNQMRNWQMILLIFSYRRSK